METIWASVNLFFFIIDTFKLENISNLKWPTFGGAYTVKQGNGVIAHRRSYTGVEIFKVKISNVEKLYEVEVNGRRVRNKEEIIKYLPDNVIAYYAGECKTMSNIVDEIEAEQAYKLKKFKNDIQEHEVFELFNKNIYYLKDIHYPILFLTKYVEESEIKLPFNQEEFEFASIKLILQKPTLFRGDSKDKYWNFQGYLRKLLELLEVYSLSKQEIVGKGKTERRVLSFNFPLHFITAIQELGIQPVEYDYKFILFNFLNLLYQIGILEDVKIKIIKKGDRITNDFDINELSEGERQLLVMDSMKRTLLESSTVLLLDEPDSYLHPRRQRELIPHLEGIYSGALYHAVIATHSPFVALSVPIESIVIFSEKTNDLIYPDLPIASYPAITSELFFVESEFNKLRENEINVFNTFKRRILEDKEINKDAFKELVKDLMESGAEIETIITRELNQLKKLKKFTLDNGTN